MITPLTELPMIAREVITPEMAKAYLGQNHRNRIINQNRVEYFVRLIKSNQFDNAVPDPIVIDKNNTLINGQHRLSAIAAAGQTIPMYIQRGSNHDLILNLDLQRKRSVRQAAYIMETTHNQFHIKMAQVMYQMYYQDVKGQPSKIQLSPQESLLIVDQFSSGIRFAEQSFGRVTGTIGPVKAALARAYYAEPDKDKLKQFGRIYNTGEHDGGVGNIPPKLKAYVNKQSRSTKFREYQGNLLHYRIFN